MICLLTLIHKIKLDNPDKIVHIIIVLRLPILSDIYPVIIRPKEFNPIITPINIEVVNELNPIS